MKSNPIETNWVKLSDLFLLKERPVSTLPPFVNAVGMPNPSHTQYHRLTKCTSFSPAFQAQCLFLESLNRFSNKNPSVWEWFPTLQHAPENHLYASLWTDPLDPAVGPLAFDVLGLILCSSFPCPYLLVLPRKLLEHSWTLSLWRKRTASGNLWSCNCSGHNPAAE